jgi:beta-lactamase class A
MKHVLISAALIMSAAAYAGSSPDNALVNKIEGIVKNKKADVGVAVLGIENDYSFSVNVRKEYPMQSVYKFHIVLAVLNDVDQGKLSLDKKIFMSKKELLPDTWSPLRDKYPDGNISVPLSEIIEATIAQSDNNGCDILLRLVGGPSAVKGFLSKKGIDGFDIKASEEESHRDWQTQFTNKSTPVSAANLLKAFYTKKIVSEKSTAYLWNILVSTKTGGGRLKGQLPKNTIVAHKTGTSDTNKNGITAAINDIGIVELPNGTHYAIAVFVANSAETVPANEKIISDVSKIVWESLTGGR